MEQIKTDNWINHIWKLPVIGAILAICGIILPASNSEAFGGDTYLWYFGFWFSTSSLLSPPFGTTTDMFAAPYAGKYDMIGYAAIILLVIALILMFTASKKVKNERDYKVAAGLSLVGGILAFIGPGAYYGYLDSEFSGFWLAFDQGLGFYLPIVAGILGIISAIAAGYASSLESKKILGQTAPYKPIPDKIAIDKSLEVTNQQEKPDFCKNCGTKLVGEFCQECGQKAEF